MTLASCVTHLETVRIKFLPALLISSTASLTSRGTCGGFDDKDDDSDTSNDDDDGDGDGHVVDVVSIHCFRIFAHPAV